MSLETPVTYEEFDDLRIGNSIVDANGKRWVVKGYGNIDGLLKVEDPDGKTIKLFWFDWFLVDYDEWKAIIELNRSSVFIEL